MKKGQRYIITHDQYSDYGICDSFIALKNFSFDKTLREWLLEHGCTEYSEKRTFGYAEGQSQQDFLEHLRREGLVADEPLNEVHIAEYGNPKEHPADDEGDG